MEQEPIELRFTTQPTSSDFVANAAAMMRRSAVTLVTGAFATTVAAITLYLGDLVGVFLLVAGLSMLTGLLMVPFVWFAIRQRRDLVLASVDVEADADGLTMTTARASSRQAWSVYRDVRETSRAFMLNTGTGAAILLAKRGMDADQVRAFRELLARVGLIRPRSAFDRVRPALWVALGAVLGIGLIVAPLLISGADATATMGIATSTDGSMVTSRAPRTYPMARSWSSSSSRRTNGKGNWRMASRRTSRPPLGSLVTRRRCETGASAPRSTSTCGRPGEGAPPPTSGSTGCSPQMSSSGSVSTGPTSADQTSSTSMASDGH